MYPDTFFMNSFLHRRPARGISDPVDWEERLWIWADDLGGYGMPATKYGASELVSGSWGYEQGFKVGARPSWLNVHCRR